MQSFFGLTIKQLYKYASVMVEIYLNTPEDIQFCFTRETKARWANEAHLVHTPSSCQMQLKPQDKSSFWLRDQSQRDRTVVCVPSGEKVQTS